MLRWRSGSRAPRTLPGWPASSPVSIHAAGERARAVGSDFYHRVGMRLGAELWPAGFADGDRWIRAPKASGRAWRTVVHRLCSAQRARLRRGQRRNDLTIPAPRTGSLEWTGILPLFSGAARGKERSCALCPEMT